MIGQATSQEDSLTTILRVVEMRCAAVTLESAEDPVGTRQKFCGPVCYWVAGRSFPFYLELTGTRLELQYGELLFLTSLDQHEFSSTGIDDCRKPQRTSDDFPCGEITAGCHSHGEVLVFKLDFGRTAAGPLAALLPPLIHIKGIDKADPIGNLLSILQQEATATHRGQSAIVDSLMRAIFGLALRRTSEGDVSLSADAVFSNTLQLMKSKLDFPWSVESLAETTSTSRSQFAMRLRELFGQAPMRYLFECRMSYAESLLRQSQVGLKSIARMIGYKSASAFSTAFKKWSGTSPQEFRGTIVGSKTCGR